MATYTGYKKITKIRKYINGVPTDEIKDNLFGQEGYIPEERSTELCPTGCDDVLDSLGNTVNNINLQTTTTTVPTTNTTTASTSTYTQYDVVNSGSTDLYLYYVGTSGPDYNYKVDANSSASINSLVDPERTSGSINFTITKTNTTTSVTNTTTIPVIDVDNYKLSARYASSNLLFEHTPIGSPFEKEIELVKGGETEVYSDTEPRIISLNSQLICPFQGVAYDSAYPVVEKSYTYNGQVCQYTLNNTDVNLFSEIEYKNETGEIKVLFLGPSQSKVVESSNVPYVKNYGDNSNITVSIGLNCRTITSTTRQPRICEKYRVENISNENVNFRYTDCNGVEQTKDLPIRTAVIVNSRETPSLNIKTEVIALNETADLETTTTTSAPQYVYIKGEDNIISERIGPSTWSAGPKTKSFWYPYTINYDLGEGEGNMDFVYSSMNSLRFRATNTSIPKRYVLEYDGQQILDTGYIGNTDDRFKNDLRNHLTYILVTLTNQQRLQYQVSPLDVPANPQQAIRDWVNGLDNSFVPQTLNFVKKAGVNKLTVKVYCPVSRKGSDGLNAEGISQGHAFRLDWNKKKI